jgi:hypothetical protein
VSLAILLVRATYFDSHRPTKTLPASMRQVPGLGSASRALSGLEEILFYANDIEPPRPEDDQRWRTAQRWRADVRLEQEPPPDVIFSFERPLAPEPELVRVPRPNYQLISIDMRSPLAVVFGIPGYAYPGFVVGLLYLAHEICRFATRASAGRTKDRAEEAVAKLAEAQANVQREAVDVQRDHLRRTTSAEAYALAVARQYGRPDYLDFFIPGEDVEHAELEELPRPETEPEKEEGE